MFYLDFFLILGLDADLAVFSGGLNFHSLLFSIVDNVVCIGFIFVLIKVFYTKFDKQGIILRKLSVNAYYMYLVHPPILITVSLLFKPLSLYPIAKLILVFLFTIIFCYLVSHLFLEKVSLKKTERITQIT